MSPDAISRLLRSPRGQGPGQGVSSGFIHYYAMFEQLSFVRREAQAEANLAWEDWRRRPCSDAYAVYVAAQDRADAAQDELANWARQAPA